MDSFYKILTQVREEARNVSMEKKILISFDDLLCLLESAREARDLDEML